MTATAAYAERRKLVPRRAPAALMSPPAAAGPTREDVAASVIKEFEGLRLDAYQDVVGVWTIGWGHTKTAKAGMRITEQQAEGLLREDMASACSAVAQLEAQCPTEFTANQAGALISFAFNIGNAGMLKSKSVAGRMRGGDYAAAADGLLKYVYAGGVRYKGLERRREMERRVFLTDPPRRPRVPIESVDEDNAPPPSVTPSAPAEKPLSQSTTVIAATTGAVTTATAAIEATAGLTGDAQRYVLIGLGAVIFATMIYIGLERWRKNRRGEEF
jgi:lysozyme